MRTRLWRMALPALAVALAACGGGGGSTVQPGFHITTAAPGSSGGPASPSPSASASGLAQFLSSDEAQKAVTLKLIAGDGQAQGGFNFNGYGGGKMTVTVPQGWKVSVTCTNQAAVPHSCAIVQGAQATGPAFPGAASPNATAGLQKGQSADFSFTADKAGDYRIACLVPGHEDAGMWDVFRVAASGSPSITAG